VTAIAERFSATSSAGTEDPGLDLAGFALLLLRSWRVIGLTMALSVACAVYLVFTTSGLYTAKLVVQTAGQQSAGGLAGALGQLGGLVGLQGAAEDREFSQFQALLKSTLLAERLQRKYGLLQIMFPTQWDAANKRWIEPSGWSYELLARLRQARNLPRWAPPSASDLAELIDKEVVIKKSLTSPTIYEITYKSGDREFAISFLDMLHRETEAAMREERKARVIEQAKYLRSRIETTPTMDYRLALVQLLADQDKTLMLLESNLPFATIVIDPPNAALRPQGAGLGAYGFAGVVSGAVLGVLIVLMRALLRQPQRRGG